MHAKRSARLRRGRRFRLKARELGTHRLCVNRTPRHIYAQIIGPGGDQTLASASTLDKEIREEVSYGGNVSAAAVVGKVIAARAKSKGVTKVAFDRSGFKYHGRIRALADAAREHGLEF